MLWIKAFRRSPAPVIYSTARARSPSYCRSGYRGVGRAIVQRRGACSVGRNPRGTPDSRHSINRRSRRPFVRRATASPKTNPAWLPRKRVSGMARDPMWRRWTSPAALSSVRRMNRSRLFQPTENTTLRNVCAGPIAGTRVLTWELNRFPGRVAGGEPAPSAPRTLPSPRISVRRGWLRRASPIPVIRLARSRPYFTSRIGKDAASRPCLQIQSIIDHGRARLLTAGQQWPRALPCPASSIGCPTGTLTRPSRGSSARPGLGRPSLR